MTQRQDVENLIADTIVSHKHLNHQEIACIILSELLTLGMLFPITKSNLEPGVIQDCVWDPNEGTK